MSRKILTTGIRKESRVGGLLRLMRLVGTGGSDLLKIAHSVAVESGYSLCELSVEETAPHAGQSLVVQPLFGGVGPTNDQVNAYVLKLIERFQEMGLTGEFSVNVIKRNVSTLGDDLLGNDTYLVLIQRKGL